MAKMSLRADGVDHGAGAEEEQRLEDAVGEQVEEARGREAGADGRHHVAELRHGRVGEHALDVVLHAGEHRGEERGEGADPRDDRQHVRREREEPDGAGEQVDAGRHHGRGVDQRGDGRRALHRVRQPDVERELRRLADGAEIDAEGDDAEPGERQHVGVRELQQPDEVEGARLAPQEHDADEQAHVAGLGRPERLDRRARRLGPLIPVADQQVGAEADQLPADEELEEVRREDEPHHREREERLVGVVAAERRRAARRADSRASRPGPRRRRASPASASASSRRRRARRPSRAAPPPRAATPRGGA